MNNKDSKVIHIVIFNFIIEIVQFLNNFEQHQKKVLSFREKDRYFDT